MNQTEARRVRQILKVSQVKTARLANVSRYRYIMWELENDHLTADELARVAKVFRDLADERLKDLAD